MKTIKVITLSLALAVLTSGATALVGSSTAGATKSYTKTYGPYKSQSSCLKAKSKIHNSSWSRVSSHCKYNQWDNPGHQRFYFDVVYVKA